MYVLGKKLFKCRRVTRNSQSPAVCPPTSIPGAFSADSLCSLTTSLSLAQRAHLLFLRWGCGREPWHSARVPSDCVHAPLRLWVFSPQRLAPGALICRIIWATRVRFVYTRGKSEVAGNPHFPGAPRGKVVGTAGPAPQPCQSRTRPRRPLQDPAGPSACALPPGPRPPRPGQPSGARSSAQPGLLSGDTARSQRLPFLPSR